MTDRAVWIGGHDDDAEYDYELALLEVADGLSRRLHELGLTRAELAERLGVSRPRITRLLSGYSNPQLRTLVQAAFALEASLSIALAPKRVTTWVEPVNLAGRRLDALTHTSGASDRRMALAA